MNTGGWVLLKNVHLVPNWLAQLEKRIHCTISDDTLDCYYLICIRSQPLTRTLTSACSLRRRSIPLSLHRCFGAQTCLYSKLLTAFRPTFSTLLLR